MHLRRALLLFAIVLGVAALVTAISEPRDRDARRPASRTPDVESPIARAQPAPQPVLTVRFDARRRRQVRRVAAGRAVTLMVSVPAIGEVDVPVLGLTGPAEPATPARFDLLADRPGLYAVRFTPARAPSRSQRIGTLAVAARRR
jgi:hypothetical protein